MPEIMTSRDINNFLDIHERTARSYLALATRLSREGSCDRIQSMDISDHDKKMISDSCLILSNGISPDIVHEGYHGLILKNVCVNAFLGNIPVFSGVISSTYDLFCNIADIARVKSYVEHYFKDVAKNKRIKFTVNSNRNLIINAYTNDLPEMYTFHDDINDDDKKFVKSLKDTYAIYIKGSYFQSFDILTLSPSRPPQIQESFYYYTDTGDEEWERILYVESQRSSGLDRLVSSLCLIFLEGTVLDRNAKIAVSKVKKFEVNHNEYR